MKTRYKIRVPIIFLFFVIISYNARSQAIEQEKYDSYDYTFTASKLTNFELKGFETRAVQKLQDYADYQSLISNKEIDLKLREQAVQLFENLFVNKNVKISKPGKEIINSLYASLTDYSKALLENNYSKIEVKVTNVAWINPLKLNEKGEYWGEISFSQLNVYFNKSMQETTFTNQRKVEIVLVKIEKDFGNKKEQVWNVLLGNIL